MSDMWDGASAVSAARCNADAQQPEAAFTPWTARFGAGTRGDPGMPDAGVQPGTGPVDLAAEAFAAGFNEGRRTVEMEVAAERDAVARLAEALEVLQPEAPEDLALLISETVERLVRQIVGEVSIDSDILVERATRVAALITDSATPTRMRLNPADLAFIEGADLPVEMVADPQLAHGTVLLETGEGWIEDGSEVGLEKVRIALDRMGVPR